MGEVENALESTIMGMLINGSAATEGSRKRLLENSNVGVSLIYKRRNVSAHREFPNGCGRFAPRSTRCPREDAVAAVGALEQSKVRAESASVVEPVPVKLPGISVGSEAPELLGSSVHEELLELSKALKSETAKPLEPMDHVESPEPTNTLEHVAVAFPDLSKALNSGNVKALDSSKSSDQMEATELTKIGGPVAMVLPEALDQIESLDMLKSLELQNTSSSQLQLPRDSILPDTTEPSKVSDQPQPSVPVVEAMDERIPKQYFPRIRISAKRDFPHGCGRNALHFGMEEDLKAIASSKNKSECNDKLAGENRPTKEIFRDDFEKIQEKGHNRDGFDIELKGNVSKETGYKFVESEGDATEEMVEQVQTRTAYESKLKLEDKKEAISKQGDIKETIIGAPQGSNLTSLDPKSQSVSKRVEKKVGSLKWIMGKESVKHSNDKSKRQLGGERDAINQSQGAESVGKKVGSGEWKMGKESVKHSNDKSKRQLGSERDAINHSQGAESVGLLPFDDRTVVLALMAAPNCPWTQRKWASISSLSDETARNKVKKHVLIVQDKSLSVSRKIYKSERSGEKSTKKKLPPAGKAAYQDVDQLVVLDEENFREHDKAEDVFVDKRSQDLELSLIPSGLHTTSDKAGDCGAGVTRKKVRETLLMFQLIFRRLLQQEESRPEELGNPSHRIDLQAVGYLKKEEKWVNTRKSLGSVPGVEVGDEFHYRVELAIIGLHGPFQAGIDYIKEGGKILATSVVASGGYEDDMDGSDVIIYSGQGGKPMKGDKKAEDQKLERGNLALKNSMDAGTVVRVIRGFKETKGTDSLDVKGKIVTTYTYDGLYLVENYWKEVSHYGTSVFKFQLRRIPGQPELALKEVRKSKKLTVREGLCVVDISQGKEKMPICAVNTVDNEKPMPFTYVIKTIYPEWYNPTPRGCDCTDGCLDSKKCSCAAKNGGEIPFNYNGAIVEAKPLVYECGPCCKCPPSCHNRVSQHGIKFQLEIFKTQLSGWGVRSLMSIPSGSFICEYTGELLQDKEAEQRTGKDEYLFDIGNNYNDHSLWAGLSTQVPDLRTSSSCEVVEDVGFTIDAAQYGSVARFINHSCSPNLYAQNVLYDNDDKRMPHIMLFAAENIPPLQELTYHYNYTIDQVYDSEGNVKKKRCYCGSAECTGWLY